MLLILIIISLEYICSSESNNCTFTHDCVGWRDGRVICDQTKQCTCRPTRQSHQGTIFYNSTSHRCVHCPKGWFYRETRCYFFYYEKHSWQSARQKCQTTYMADLIVFNNVDDLYYIQKHISQIDGENQYFHIYDNDNTRRYWIGGINEPFVRFGQFSWIDNTGFTFDQYSPMWCKPNISGVPVTYERQPSWNKNNINETRVSLIRWQHLSFNKLPVLCLNDEKPDELVSLACQRTSNSFKTKCETTNFVCQNGGICTSVTDSEQPFCDCAETPYSGTYCTEKCGVLPSHCQNGGNCTSLSTCTCTSLWKGPVCTEAIDPCLSNPCQHDTKCTQVGNTLSFDCDCGDSGWTGELCDITKYPCPAGRCPNNGQCKVAGLGNFTCNCMTTGYQGPLCEQGCHDTNEPCQNSGSCIDNECVCSSSTKGDFCEIVEDKDSASSHLKNEKSGLQIWLITVLCTVSVVLIVGLIYGRKKLLKKREQRRNSIENDNSSMVSSIQKSENIENDSVSVTSSQASQATKYMEEYSTIDDK